MGHEHFKSHVNKTCEQISPPVCMCILVKRVAAPTVSCNPVHAYYDYIFELMDFRPTLCRYQWPRGLRRRSAAARLLSAEIVGSSPTGGMDVCLL